MTRTAPARVRSEAKLGLELHKKWKRGGTAVGVARAVQLSSGKAVSDTTIKRMYSYFQRHQHDRLDKDGSDGSIPGRGYIAWLLWGGNSGRKWAEGEYKKIQGKKKNPISKPVKKIKEDLAKKTIYLIKVSLDDYRSEAWAQEMVTKEEDFEVVDNYDDDGEPIFKTSEYVLAVVPKKYLQDFEFLRRMQLEGKLEKHSFTSAARAWLENDQPLDWFNEQAQDRGYLTKDEYLFLVKVNNPVMIKKNILDEVKTNDEVLQLKSFIEGNGLKKQNPEDKNIRKKRFTKDPEIWVKAKLLEMAILTALKASGEHGLSLRTLSEATLFIMGKKYDKTTVKSRLPMTILRVIDEWKDRELDFVANAEATSSSPAHSLMQRKPSFVYIIRSKGIEYLEQLKKEIVEALKIADETKDMDSLISLIKRERPEKEEIEKNEEIEENPLKMSNPARNVANVEDVRKFCERALEEFDEALGYNADANRYFQTNIMQWFRSNFFKGIMNSERTQDYFIDLNEDNYQEIYFEHTGNYEWPDFVEKSIREGKKIEFFHSRNGRYFIDFSMEHFADFFDSGNFPANPSRVSYDQMIDLVLRWDEKDVKVSDESKIAEGEVVFKEYLDGMKWVLLTNKQAIENESRISRMGHCIGRVNGRETSNSYIDKVVHGVTRKLTKKDARARGKEGDLTSITENVKGYTFSLRDKENHPYVTCFYQTHTYKEKPEQNQGYFSEIKGYKNCHINTITYHQVDKKDRKGIEKLGCHDLPKVNSNEKYVIDLIRDERIEDLTQCKHDTKLTSFCDDLTYLADFVTFEVVPDYRKVDLNDDFEKDLKRYILTNEEFERLNLSKLNLPYAAIYDEQFNKKTKLPPNLTVFAPEDFETYTLKELPDGFKVIGNLILDEDIEKVGDGIIVEGDLFFTSDKKALADKIEAQTKKSTDVVLKKLKDRNRNPVQQKLYLFSYGSNNPDQLAERLERQVKTKGAYAEDMARIFVGHSNRWNGAVASIEPQENKTVYGLVAEVTEADLKKMDVFEGVASGKYKRKNIKVTLQSGEEVSAVAYIASDSTRARPSQEYLKAVAKTISAHWKGERGEDVKVSDIKTNNPLEIIARGIDERPASAYDREELKLGLKTELEHTDDAIIASKIAKDHLDEDPKYYSKLVEMERGMKKSNPEYFLGNPIKLFNKSIRFEVDARTLERSILPYLLLSEIKKNSPNGITALRLKDNVIERLERVFPSEEIGESKPFEFHVSVLYPMIEYFEKRKYISRMGTNPYCITDFGDKTLENWANTISKINQFIEMEKGMKKSNPITPASEEYLDVVQKALAGVSSKVDAWIDENSGDILVGSMAFEEDRSFDDVLVRIKTSGRILQGESVDDSIRKFTEKLMKKIHNELVNYVTHKKSNPVPAGVDAKEFDSLVEKLKKRKDVDNPYALANWILKQKNPTAYEKLVKQLAAKGVDDPKALAAWIGRQKYGKEEFQRRAAAGRKKKKGG